MKAKRIILISLVSVLLVLFAWSAGLTQGDDDKLVDDVIILQKLQKDYEYGDFYGPVEFQHFMHTMYVGDCTTCHHYFDHHMTEGVLVESMRTDENCKKCHHMEEEPFSEPMQCILCHPEGVDEYIAELGNFACDVCHELDKSFDTVRLVELEDGTTFNPPSLQAIYHLNCMTTECHPSHREDDKGNDELACDKCHVEKEK